MFLLCALTIFNPFGGEVTATFKRFIRHVKVVNDMDMPVPVVVKGRAKEPWTASAVFTFDGASPMGCSGPFYTVPEGKQLLVKFASGFGPNPTQQFSGDRYDAFLLVTFMGTDITGPNPKGIHFDVSTPSLSGKLVRFGQQVHLPLGEGSQIDFCVRRSGNLTDSAETLVGVLNGFLKEVG